MAFLVEHKTAGEAEVDHRAARNSYIPPEASSRPGTMKLLRQSSSKANGTETSPSESRNSSVSESSRKTSFSAIPTRFRRRRTKSHIDTTQEENGNASRLGELFFSLPSEILVQIICNLSNLDISALRLTSRLFNSILNHNASVISRYVLYQAIFDDAVAHAFRLYPVPSSSNDLRYLIQMLHRQHRIDKAIYPTLSYVQMKMYMISSYNSNAVSLNPENRQNLAEALQKPAWTVYHFLESYRDVIIAQHDEEHGKESGKFWDCKICESKAKALIKSHPGPEIMDAFHFLQLLLHHIGSATRPPVSPGPKLRPWAKSMLTDEDMNIFIFLGGIEEMGKINMMQGSYNKRIETIDSFATKVRTAVDINHSNTKTSSQKNLHIKPQYQARQLPDVTKSLAPPYSILTRDHLDRLPMLNEFLLPIWQECIEHENLHRGNTRDLENPFEWIQRILYYGTSDPPEQESEQGHEQTEDQENVPQPNQPANNAVTVPPPQAVQPTPRHLPLYGASPI